MTLDPQVKAFLDYLAAKGVPPMHTLSPEQNRLALKRSINRTNIPAPTVAKVQDRWIPVKDGEIKIRIYSPDGEGPWPILVYFHGGGFIMGDLDTVDAPLRALTDAVHCIVISVNYRLAPEYKFPTAVEDCYTAIKWAFEHAEYFGGDPARIATAGDSAGGNLATVMALLARERGGPSLCAQVLLYPCTDQLNDYPSHHEFAAGYFITLKDIKQIQKCYFMTEKDKANIYASPLLVEDLSCLPQALIVTAGYDPLHDEGEAYANRLGEAGVKVDYFCYDGMIHGFFGMAGIFDEGKALIEQVANYLKNAFTC